MLKKIDFIISDKKKELLFLIFLIIGITIIMSGLNPIVLKLLIDKGIRAKNINYFIITSIIAMFVFTLGRVANMFLVFYSRKLKNKLIKTHTNRMLKKYYNIPYIQVLKKDVGYYSSLIYEEPAEIIENVVTVLTGISRGVFVFIISVSVSFYLSWKITIILLFIMPILYFLSKKFNSKITNKSKKEKTSEADLRENIQKSIKSYKTVKIYNLFANVKKIFNIKIDKYLDIFYKRVKIQTIFNTLSRIFISYQEIAIIISAGYIVMKGEMTMGGFIAYMNAFNMAAQGFRSIVDYIPEYSKVLGFIERLIDYEKMAAFKPSFKNFILKKNDYSFNNISFKYPNEKKNILKEINLVIKKNKKNLIKGDNGTGKTTIVNLLIGLLKPNKGKIVSENIDNISLTYIPFNFIEGNLKNNVNYNNLNPKKKNLFHNLIHKFNLKNYINHNPKSLSAGQKQKFAIILSLLKDSEIYIYDEPLANIDKDSKNKIIKTIFEYTNSKTILVIMHNHEYDNRFDNIINLNLI